MMTDNSPDSAEDIQNAAAIAKSFVENFQNDDWQRVAETKNRGENWEIKFRTDEAATVQSVIVNKETANIVDTDLVSNI